MARPLTRQALTLIAGLLLLGSVVACGGGGSAPIVPGAGGATASSAGGYASSAVVGGPAAITTYTNVVPLTFYSAGGVIDFLTTPVTTATVLQPFNTGVLTSQQFVIPMSCAVQVGALPIAAASDKRSAALASATPPPTPAPVLTPTNCLIVAYANNGTTAIPVTAYAGSDGINLVFPASTTGLNYVLGTNYTFYVAIATVSTPTPGPTATPKPTPGPTSSPGSGSCHGDEHDNHHGDGHDGDRRDSGSLRHLSDEHHGDRHEHDNGNHKDCGFHNGDGHDNHDGHDGHDGHDSHDHE